VKLFRQLYHAQTKVLAESVFAKERTNFFISDIGNTSLKGMAFMIPTINKIFFGRNTQLYFGLWRLTESLRSLRRNSKINQKQSTFDKKNQ